MRKSERGVALVLVLGAVALLAALAVELASRASVDALVASRSVRDAGFRRLFDSGAEIAKGMLVELEAKPCDFWGEPWNDEVRFSLGPVETGRVRVADESGKINIARAVEKGRLERMLRRLFSYLKAFEPGTTREWNEIESRVLGRLALGEAVDPAAGAKAEPLLTLDGLRETGLRVEQIFGERGLARYLTSFGDGKINLNTAPRAVLYALDDEFDAAVVDRIAEYRGDPEGAPGAYKPFEAVKDLELVDGVVERSVVGGQPRIVRNLATKVAPWVTTKSTAFSARVEARWNHNVRQAWVFFEPKRVERPGEGPRRELRHIALEEILP